MKRDSERTPPSSVSGHEPQIWRTIIHEPEYDQAKTAIFADMPLADEALRGLEDFLSCRAEMGFAYREDLPDSFLTFLSKPLPEGQIRVLYYYDDHIVQLIDAWLLPDIWRREW